MADNNQNSNNSQVAPKGIPSADQNSVNNSAAAGWITVNTSDSFEAQRMNIMKGNSDNLFTKSER